MIVRRIGRFRARILFAVFVLMATLYFLGLSYVHPTTPMLYGGIFLLWGSYGMATIVSIRRQWTVYALGAKGRISRSRRSSRISAAC